MGLQLIHKMTRKLKHNLDQTKTRLLDEELHVFSKNFGSIRSSRAEPHSSVGSIADLRTGGRWFDPRLGQYSFQKIDDSH